jgi:site-specific DNA-methyltransferase (adenine-specific)
MMFEDFDSGRIRLYYGTCEALIPKLKTKPKSIDLALIDPPYNIGYKYNTYKDNLVWEDYYRSQKSMLLGVKQILKAKGSILYLNYPEQAAVVWTRMLPYYYPVEWWTWIYHQHTGGKPLRKATRAWLWMAKNTKHYIGEEALLGEYQNPTDKRIQERIALGFRPVDYDWFMLEQVKNVCKDKTEHPCQLPVEMVERLIKASCPPDGLIFDPYLGSATTAVACLNTGRRFVGAECDPAYYQICLNRMSKAMAEKAIKSAQTPQITGKSEDL